ncbi:transcriptional regulator, MerR family [Caenispirillum salinarum AK4]|uniref:Transcriptional regulator, MerR family n=1 Tax=Caenispirillum salinarum AK4 TaxID=1238182 RepID=K9GUG9_9PROT|nr:class I SAM-dependent methyltransferase [Caenispirillum salinarum]EKV28399.1 transcriptional regulator, MerR family [Caenispirillum salinarum AK4]
MAITDGGDDPFFLIHSDLPREGPGTDDTTRQAIERLPPLPEQAAVLDLGCGPGRHTIILAKILRRPVTGIDLHRPYLERMMAEAARQGVGDLVRARQEDMMRLSDPAESIDLIWSEGAAYSSGVGEALTEWRRVLKPAGLCVFSELTWLTDDPPEEPRDFWADNYPAMTGIDGNRRFAENAGYHVFDHWVMPPAAWWPDYYTPLRRRCDELAPIAEHDSALAGVLAGERREIDVFARSNGSYSYVFYYLRKR